LQQENDQVVTQFIQSHPDFSIIPTETTNQLPSHSQQATLTILPSDFNSDGFFVATIKKSDK
jgi:16S rRNA (cytosine967-C5)-methyltransferase